jgi:hypothetical protein
MAMGTLMTTLGKDSRLGDLEVTNEDPNGPKDIREDSTLLDHF